MNDGVEKSFNHHCVYTIEGVHSFLALMGELNDGMSMD